MSLNADGLGFVFEATDNASRVMKIIESNLDLLQKSAGVKIADISAAVGKLGAGFALMGVGAGAFKGMFNLAEKAGSLERSLADYRKISFANDEQMKRVEKASQAYAMKYGKPPEEVVSGFAMLAQQGYKVEDSLRLLPVVMDGATAGNLRLEDSVSLLHQALSAFGIDSQLARFALDQMQNGANEMEISLADLRIGIGRMGQQVRSVGGQLGEAVVMFGLAKNVMGQSELAATGVGKAFGRLANPKVQAMLHQRLNIDVVDSNGNFKSAFNTIVEMSAKFDQLGGNAEQAQFLMEAFGQQGGRAVGSVFEQMRKGFKDADGNIHKGAEGIAWLRGQVEKLNDSVAKASAIVQDTFTESLNRLDASAKVAGENIGKPFAQMFRPIVEGLTAAVGGLGESFAALSPETQKTIAGFSAAAAGMAILIGAGTVLTALSPVFSIFWKIMEAGFAVFVEGAAAAAIAMWPLFAALAVVAGLAYLISNNIGGMGAVWDRMTAMFRVGLDAVTGSFKTVSEFFGKLIDNFVEGFQVGFQYMMPIFKNLYSAFDGVLEAVYKLGSAFTGFGAAGGYGTVMVTIVHVLGTVLSFVAGILVFLVTVMLRIVQAVIAFAAAIVNFLRPVLVWLWNILGKIAEKFQTVLEFLGLWKKESKNAAGPNLTGPMTSEAPVLVDPTAAQQSQVNQTMSKAPEPSPAAIAALAPVNGFTNAPMSKDPINYDAMAQACSQMNVTLVCDNEKIAQTVARGARSLRNRGVAGDLLDR